MAGRLADKIALADLDPAAATETARRVEAGGGRVLAVRTDTTEEAATDDAAFFTGEILHPSGGVFVG